MSNESSTFKKKHLAGRVAGRLRRMHNAWRPNALFESNCRTLLFHRADALAAEAAVTGHDASPPSDEALVKRIVAAYGRAQTGDLGDSMWKAFFATHHESIHQTLVDGRELAIIELLRNPAATDLFYGFDILNRTHHSLFAGKGVRNGYAKLCFDGLIRFAEAVGAIPLDNPETWGARTADPSNVEDVLSKLAAAGIDLKAPNPFPQEHGLASPVGVISYRVPQALYQAYRIKQLVKGIADPRVLEIGAGLGRTAYYAHAMGIRNYTLVDIPLSAVAQAHFLGTTLGGKTVLLEGEHSTGESGIRIVGPATFLGEDRRYDLIVNVDSLPEMDSAVATLYWKKIQISTTQFLSINHEANSFRVRDLIKADLGAVSVHRGLYWMRRGYVEEVIRV